mmetsp:Transcript_111136/g.175175  ORF Transcript_111136/g.175175 Transcript_111136/m.175175 type:complete len:97 (+) Transcript_111136:276-566(+)
MSKAVEETRREIRAIKEQIAAKREQLNLAGIAPETRSDRASEIGKKFDGFDAEDLGDDEKAIDSVLSSEGGARRPMPSSIRSCAPFRAQCIGIGRH